MAGGNGRIAQIAAWSALIVLAVVLNAAVVAGGDLSTAVLTAITAVLVVGILAAAVGLAPTASGLLVIAFATVGWNDLTLGGALDYVEVSDAFFVAGFLLVVARFASLDLRLPTTFTLGATGLTLCGVVAAAVNDAPSQDLGYVIDVVQGVVVLPALVAWWGPRSRTAAAAAGAYVVGNAISVIAGLSEGAVHSDRYDGWSTHPNALGACSLLSFALLPFIVRTVPRQHRWLGLVGALSSTTGIWISGSRAALVCACILTILYPVVDRSIRAALGLAVLAIPGVFLAVPAAEDAGGSNPIARLVGDAGADAAAGDRIEGARTLFQRIIDDPIAGGGWDGVWGGHNIYLQVGAAIGLFGAISFVIIVATLVKPLFTAAGSARWLAYPAFAAAIIGVVDPAVGARYIWAPVALAMCAYRWDTITRDHASASSRRPRHAPIKRNDRISP